MAKTKEKIQKETKPDAAQAAKRRKAKDKGSAIPMTLLADMMRSPLTSASSSAGKPVLESGVLAYRRRKNGEPEILMISKKRTKNWGIPKGKAESNLHFGESAAKEAFEEAGVVGHISPSSIGMFRMMKRNANSQGHQVIEVWVYLLEVTETLSNWPEKGKREIKWVSCEVAAQLLREPMLVQLCHRLAKS